MDTYLEGRIRSIIQEASPIGQADQLHVIRSLCRAYDFELFLNAYIQHHFDGQPLEALDSEALQSVFMFTSTACRMLENEKRRTSGD